MRCFQKVVNVIPKLAARDLWHHDSAGDGLTAYRLVVYLILGCLLSPTK